MNDTLFPQETGPAAVPFDALGRMAAIENEVARLSRLYAALSHINQAIVWADSRQALFDKVCRVLVEHGGFRMAWIGWNDPQTRRLVPLAQFGDDGGYLQRIQVSTEDRPEGRGQSGTAYREGRACLFNDLLDNPVLAPWRAELERHGFRASGAFPIRVGGVVGGTLTVYSERRDYFHDKEVALLAEAATDISFGLDNFARDEARREAEQALRNEMLFSRTMLESMPGVVYFYDAAGRFLRWNKNFETVSGYTATEIAAMHPLDFFCADDRLEVERRIAEAFATGQSSVEAGLTARDGSVTPYFLTGQRIDFQQSTCLVGVGIDVSERQRAEARLRQSEAHLVEAQRIAGIGSWALAASDLRLVCSDQVYEIFGLSRAGFATSVESLIGYVHAEDRARLDAGLRAALAGRERLEAEFRIVRPDGGERVLHALADLKRDGAGRPLELAGTLHDITARVRIEAEREKRHRAEAADRIKSAFLATMSHELRTPLNSIIGFTGIVLKGLAGPLNDEQGKQLGMVRASARHLLALVNDVLDISKIEAGQLEVSRERFDLRRSIDKVVGLVMPQAQAKGLALAVQLAPGLGEAVSDERRFEQILLNLLSNAIKFTERGEIVLRAGLTPDAAIRLQVQDSGIGIRPTDLTGLFEPFRQIDSGLARSHEGTGLGLAICQRLAELMGGEIGVESEWGRGSTFSVTLPLEGPVSA